MYASIASLIIPRKQTQLQYGLTENNVDCIKLDDRVFPWLS